MLKFIHPSPILNARELCDRHLMEQGHRANEALATCHRILDGIPGRMRRTHTKFEFYKYQFMMPEEFESFPIFPLMYESPEEPFCKWLVSGTSVYEWLIAHYYACGREYSFRHSKSTYAMRYLNRFKEYPKNIKQDDITPVYLDLEDVRKAYYDSRNCTYEWTRRGAPHWWPKK